MTKKLHFSPQYLRVKSLTQNLQDNPEKLSPEEVRKKCFEVLGLFDEMARSSKTHEKSEEDLEVAEAVVDLDSYVSHLDSKENAPSENTEKPSKRNGLRNKVRELLAFPQVRNMLQTEMNKETARLKPVLPKLRRLKKVQKAESAATLDMHKTYLQSKRNHKGKLVETAKKRIEALGKVVAQAESEEKTLLEKANSVERGFMTAQELMEYKEQLGNQAFALTKSRKDLLKKLVEHAMAGQKIFLVGATGTGKTELAFYAANELTGDYEIIPWHEGTVMKDIMGQMQISKNAEGDVESNFKLGPLPRALTKGRTAIHEEFTAGSTRTMMGMKPYMNLRPGSTFKIPEMNGTILRMDEKALEIFTANLKDERTTEREDLDPAILRMLKGIKVAYMPADELFKVTLASLMDDNGILELSKSEVELIQRLSEAAEMMQQCHEGQIEGEAAESLKQVCGVEDLRINKNFLDTGTFMRLFAKYDYEKCKGVSLAQYLAGQLEEFIGDPKGLNVPEERRLALGILKLKGVISKSSREDEIQIEEPTRRGEKTYLLPSEFGFISRKETVIEEEDPFGEEVDEVEMEENQSEIIEMLGNDVVDKLNGLLISMDKQYSSQIKTLSAYGFLTQDGKPKEGDAPLPNRATALSAFKREQLEIAKDFQNPTLLLIPNCSFASKVKALDANKKGEQKNNTFVSDKYKESDSGSEKITGWQVVIVEGANEMELKAGDDVEKTFLERVKERKDQQKDGEKGMDRHTYIHLMMESLQNGTPTDKDTCTLLDDDSALSDAYVPSADFDSDGRRVYFNWNDPGNANASVRLRSSVKGEISGEKKLSPEQKSEILATLEARFKSKPEHYKRIEGIEFAEVKRALEASPEALFSLYKMEETGGEPDVAGADGNEFIFEDRSKESPIGRRDLNFDQSLAQANEFGVGMQSKIAYRDMQNIGKFDLNSRSWLETDPEQRKTGNALSGFRDGGDVGVYVFNADNSNPNKGWRASLRVKKV